MKKTISIVMALLICLCCFPVTGFAVEGGSEVPEGYIGVYTIEDLYCVRNDLTANYILMNDIDLSEATAEGGDWNYGGRGWNPIGSNDVYGGQAFSGIFDGNGYSVKGMNINIKSTVPSGTADLYLGLFSNVSGTIRNLTVSGSVSSEKALTAYIGGIAGYCGLNAFFENCVNLVDIYCYNTAPIYAGGIVGFNNGSIYSCRNLGKIEISGNNSSELVSGRTYRGNSFAAGIAGKTDQSESIISECINAGEIIAVSRGGYERWTSGGYYLNPQIYYYYYYADVHASGITSGGKGSVVNCYNIGDISATLEKDKQYAATNAAGISYNCQVSECYNIANSTGYSVGKSAEKCYCVEGSGSLATGVVALTAGQMKLKSMYSGWDFDSVWTMDGRGDYNYPELRNVRLLITKEDAAHKHKYTSEITTPATHTAEGVKTFTCACGDSYTETIAKLAEHTYEEIVIAPTCVKKGYSVYLCECGDTYSKEKAALGHSFTEKIIDSEHLVSAATKESPAVYKYDCANCDAISDKLTFTYGNKLDSIGKISTVTATQTTSSVKLVWSEVSGANIYRVYQKNASGWTTLGEVSKLNGTIKNLKAGTKYTFAVKAGKKVNGKTEWSKVYVTISTATKAVKPATVTASQNTSSISLNWAKSAGADGYRIFYKSGGKWKTTVSSTTALSHTFKNLNAGAKYTFAIQPYIKTESGVVWGEYAEYAASTTPATVTAKVSSPSAGKISLTWNAVNGADGYRVYYKINNGSYKLYKVYSEVKKLTFSNLNSSNTYTFAVRAGIKTSGGNIFGAYNAASINPDPYEVEPLTNADVLLMWMDAYSTYYLWGERGVFDYLDKSRGIYFNGSAFTYYPVVHPTIKNKSQLKNYLLCYFDETICEDILSRFLVYNGEMYISLPTGMGINPEMKSVVIKKQSGDYIELYVTFENYDGSETVKVQKMRCIDGNWVFAEYFYNA